MRRTLVPPTAVLAGGATTVLWIGGVLLTHAVDASSTVEALNTIGQLSTLLLTAGIPGGLVTGALADDYAPLMKQGMLAVVGGATAVVVAVGGYGIALSISLGYGADSVLTLMFTAPTMFTFVALVPMMAIEGVVFALVGESIAGQLRKRAAV